MFYNRELKWLYFTNIRMPPEKAKEISNIHKGGHLGMSQGSFLILLVEYTTVGFFLYI